MERITPEKLKSLIEEAGTTATALSVAIDRDKNYVRDYLVGRKKSLKPDDLQKIKVSLGLVTLDDSGSIKPIAGLKVLGIVRAGTFVDTSLVNQGGDKMREFINVAQDPRFTEAAQYALLVSGDSMNKRYEDGCYVTCASWAETGLALKSGMRLHIEKHDGDLVENTLKLYVERDGKRWLEPESTNQVHKIIELNGNEATEIIVKGLVTGSWKPETY